MSSRRFEEIVQALDEGGRLKGDATGRTEVRARCPAHNGTDDNLAVFTGSDGGAAVKCHSRGCSTEAILRALDLYRERRPAPAGTARYEARTIADPNQIVGHHVITNRPGHAKKVRWEPAGIRPTELALYRSWDLKPTDTLVVVCEGERATEAVIAAGFAALGTQTGAGYQPADEALAILNGRDVVLWADKDEAGRKHMEELAGRLGPCRLVDVSDAPDKWDGADASTSDIRRLVQGAQPYVVTAPTKRAAKESAATRLVNLAHGRNVVLLSDQDGVPYLADGHAVLPFQGGEVAKWLRQLAWEQEAKVLSSDSVKEAASTLEAEALFGGTVEEVFLRVAPIRDGMALDLGTPDFTAAVVRPSGWSVEEHPVRFRRPRTLGPLPVPIRGGQLSDLTALMNLGDDRQTKLMIGFLIGSLCPTGPYALLGLTGEQGSAKSFTARLTRRTIDPVLDGNGLKSLTKSDESFWTVAYHSWLPAFDNISGLSAEQSDRFAQLATGAGRTARRLFSDGEEYTQSACRPAILNGIELAERPDLLSRTITLSLPRIEGGWTVEQHLTAGFDAKHPALLGALLDVMVGVVGRIAALPMTGWKARMPDHIRWVTAGEPALGWPDGTYEALFEEAQDLLMAEAALGIVWLADLHSLIQNGSGTWSGTAGDLLGQLTYSATGSGAAKLPDRGYGWPKTGKGMNDALNRYAPVLRTAGIVHHAMPDPHSKQLIHDLSYSPTGPQGWIVSPAGVAGVAGVNSPSATDREEEAKPAEPSAMATPETTPLHRETTPATPATPATTERIESTDLDFVVDPQQGPEASARIQHRDAGEAMEVFVPV